MNGIRLNFEPSLEGLRSVSLIDTPEKPLDLLPRPEGIALGVEIKPRDLSGQDPVG